MPILLEPIYVNQFRFKPRGRYSWIKSNVAKHIECSALNRTSRFSNQHRAPMNPDRDNLSKSDERGLVCSVTVPQIKAAASPWPRLQSKMPPTPDAEQVNHSIGRNQSNSVIMSHFQTSTLKPTFNIESLISLGAVENALYAR